MTISLKHQRAEVVRELSLRRRLYPGFVASGRMSQSEADRHIERMEAVLHTIETLRKPHQVDVFATAGGADAP